MQTVRLVLVYWHARGKSKFVGLFRDSGTDLTYNFITILPVIPGILPMMPGILAGILGMLLGWHRIERSYWEYDGFIIIHGTDTLAHVLAHTHAQQYLIRSCAHPVLPGRAPFMTMIRHSC